MAKKAKTNTEENTPDEQPKWTAPKNWKPPWKKGKSGNPNGRPKGAKDGLDAHLRRQLTKNAPEDRVYQLEQLLGHNLESGTFADVIAGNHILMALYGDLDAMKELYKRTVKPLPQAIEHSGPDGGAMTFQQLLVSGDDGFEDGENNS